MTSAELMATARHVASTTGIPLEEALGNIVPRLNDDRAKLIRQTHRPHNGMPGLYISRNREARICGGGYDLSRNNVVLIELDAGLGDSVALTIILQHLQKYRPDWKVGVWVRPGFEAVGNGLCEAVFASEGGMLLGQFDLIYRLDFYAYDWLPRSDSPSTPVVNCLRETFGIQPDRELLKYKINPTGSVNTVGKRHVLIHHESTGGEPQNKNLTWDQIEPLWKALKEWGYVPFILTGNTEIEVGAMAAMIRNCSLFVGIDSGPLHVAGATDTPSIGVWTKHHPLAYFDLCPNVMHLIPDDHEKMWPLTDPDGLFYWKTMKYNFCRFSDLPSDLCREAGRKLGIKT